MSSAPIVVVVPLTRRDTRRDTRRPMRAEVARHHRRRMALDTRVETIVAPESALRHYWDAHAVKTGFVAFWLWFAAANAGPLLGLWS